MSNNVKFSIIIPVYNVSQYLRECLDSVLAQTYRNWECICVDDGSEDDSGIILDEYSKKDKRIKVIHKENGGVASARNVALDIMCGEWFLFLDSDDVWSKKLLSICEKGITKEIEIDMIKFLDLHFPENKICNFEDENKDPIFYKKNIKNIYSYKQLGFMAQKIAFKSSRFYDIREKQYTVGEDLLFLTECGLRADNILCINLKLYGYRDRVGSAIRRKPNLRMMLDSLHYIVNIAELFKIYNKKIAYDTKKWIGNAISETTIWNLHNLVNPLEYKELKNEWRIALKKINELKVLGHLQNLRILILTNYDNFVITFLLCLFPCYLKRTGIHR